MKLTKKILKLNIKRGILENDLILNKYLDKYEKKMSIKDKYAFLILTNFSDFKLLNLIFKKKIKKTFHPNIKKILKKIKNLKLNFF
ncbi:succinate dehydrogenase assembly factor 2 [Candidatus Zinderia endosymbiont of Aphrophora alni]|uniref:succinate dehydrogenase assembly factor 2 n=1 Tax=Candidatus Zinderia endosymbiont of Aphrophora alni TaxID=3077951 RepID=UPI0030CCBD25